MSDAERARRAADQLRSGQGWAALNRPRRTEYLPHRWPDAINVDGDGRRWVVPGWVAAECLGPGLVSAMIRGGMSSAFRIVLCHSSTCSLCVGLADHLHLHGWSQGPRNPDHAHWPAAA